jgi:hypothetical protein
MVHFQRYDGTSAEIDPMWTTPDYRINEISEAEWDRGEELEARLLGSLATILSDPDLQRLVIETPEYYLIRPQWLVSSILHAGSAKNTLGTMLQWWSASDELRMKCTDAVKLRYIKPEMMHVETPSPDAHHDRSDPESVEVMFMQVSGSFSGAHSSLAWCTKTKEIYVVRSSRHNMNLPENLWTTYRKFRSVADTISVKLELKLVAMERLLLAIE